MLSSSPAKSGFLTSSSATRRVGTFFSEQLHKIHRRTDRLFAVLMIVQWIAGIVAACAVSPRAWSGAENRIHPHLFAAVFLGGLIASLPVALVFLKPGAAITRHTVAVAQMLFSAL